MEEKLIIFASGGEVVVSVATIYLESAVRTFCSSSGWDIEDIMEFCGFVWVSIL